jgi:putative oxidoreductase
MFRIPSATGYLDLSILLLRVVVAFVFGTSGFNHLKSPKERAASIGMPVRFTVFIGAAELAAALGLAAGLLIQWAALGLILIMFGAIYKKLVEWKTGFWGDKSTGWHYELLFIAMLFVILTTNGGRFALGR